MRVVTSEQSPPSGSTSSSDKRSTLLSLFTRWELYLLLLMTLYLHFAYIRTFEFDNDQVSLLRMAYDALHYGFVPAVSNVASIGIANPPGTIFLFLIPELFTANPLAANIFVATCTTIAIFLTYMFVHRYYGRVAAIVATFLYATAATPLLYARFIWQPNLMPPFVVFFLFALFEGAVRRRKGWLLPALVLYGLLYQMHPTAILLAAPLCVALLLAPETFRWRDLGLAILCLLVLFSPYLLFEYLTKFVDIKGALTFAKQPAKWDSQALSFYLSFLSPNNVKTAYFGPSLLRFTRRQSVLGTVTMFLVVVSALLLLLRVLIPRASAKSEQERPVSNPLRRFWRWWTQFRTGGNTCGFILLLVWQVVPLVVLSHHSVGLHSQYFFLLFPGPFILIGILVANIAAWTLRHRPWAALLRYATYMVVALLVVAQFAGSVAIVLDTGTGRFNDRGFQPYHNSLNSLQDALSAADQLARQQHLGHVYITTDSATESSFRYLTEGTKTPTTLFDASSCLVLPNSVQGDAVFLVGPYDDLVHAMLAQLSSATLVKRLPRVGGSPFSLYIVRSRPAPLFSPAFEGHLQATGLNAVQVKVDGSSWLISQWQLLRSESPAHLTTYNYIMHVSSSLNGKNTNLGQATCTLSSLQAGDQLFVATSYPRNGGSLTSVNTSVQYYTQVPDNLTFGPITLGTGQTADSPWMSIPVTGGKQYIPVKIR